MLFDRRQVDFVDQPSKAIPGAQSKVGVEIRNPAIPQRDPAIAPIANRGVPKRLSKVKC